MSGPRDAQTTAESSHDAPRPDALDERLLLPTLDEERFEVGEERARGGIGRILEAHDEFLGRRVALKQLLRGQEQHETVRFMREAMLTARLQHPSIVPVYDAGVRASGEAFYTMPLWLGGSLLDALRAAGSLDARLALLPHVQAVVDAIAYAHDQGIVHRDLKPANVLVGPFGETVVIDWGLAKDLRGSEPARGTAPPRVAHDLVVDVTLTGAAVGTPAYMAPEQARGEEVDVRSDVYAIGALLYHVLTGVTPHGSSGEQGAPAHAPVPLDVLEPSVPRDLVAIVGKAMAPDPGARYASAKELAVDLRRFATGQLVEARRYSAWTLVRRWLRRHRPTVSVALALLLALAMTAIVSARRVVDARDRAESEANRLRLLQAEAVLDRDPTAAAAWLGAYQIEPGSRARAARVAARAAEGGVARWVLTLPDDAPRLACLSPSATHALVLGRSGAVWRFDLRAATRRYLGTLGATPTACSFDADGRRFVALAETGLRVGGIDDDALWTPPVPGRLGGFAWDSARRLLVVGDGQVWRVELDARAVRPIGGLPAGVTRAVPAREGDALFVVDVEGTLWQGSQAGTPARLLERLGEPVYSLSLSHDGRRLVLGTDTAVLVRDLERATSVRTDLGSTGSDPVRAHAAGTGVVYIVGRDQAVAYWRPQTDELTRLGDQGFYKTLVVTEDGGRAVWTNLDGSVFAADVDAGVTRTLVGHPSAARDLAITPDGRFVAVTYAGMVRIFPLEARARRAWSIAGGALQGHRLLRSQRALLYGEEGGRLVRYDLDRGERHVVAELGEAITCLVTLPGDEQAIVGTGLGGVMRVELASGAVHELGRLEHAVRAVDELGMWVVAEDNEHVKRLWEVGNWKPLGILPSDQELVARSRPLPPSRRDRARFGVTVDRSLVVHDAKSGEVQALTVDGYIFTGRLSEDEDHAVIGLSDGRVLYWNLGELEARPLAQLPGYVSHLYFSSDGREVLAAEESGTVVSIRLVDGRVRPIGAHEARVNALTQSPSGLRVASGDTSGELRVFEPATGQVAVLRGHSGTIWWVAFVSDELLVSLDARGELRLNPLPPELFVPGEARALDAWLDARTTARLVGEGAAVESPVTTIGPTPPVRAPPARGAHGASRAADEP